MVGLERTNLKAYSRSAKPFHWIRHQSVPTLA